MTQDMDNKIMTRNTVNLTRGQAPCEIRTSLRLRLDDITARRQRHYGSPATTLRLVVTLLLMMVVGATQVNILV